MKKLVVLLALSVFAVPQAAQAALHHRHKYHHHRTVPYGHGNVVGSRPSGCPSSYCGCALARILGIHTAQANLAAWWSKAFPRSEPHPGAVAVKPGGHHVVLLREHVGGSIWTVYDPNSGHGQTRIHPRSLAGWTFVTPS